MKVTWNAAKARSNRLKHRVFFADAESVFYDPRAVTIEDVGAEEETRFVTIGMDSLGRVTVVVYTYRDADVRLISARRATRTERRAYEKGI